MSDMEYFESVVGPMPRSDSSRYVANTMAKAADTIDTALAAHIEAIDDFVTRIEKALEKWGGVLDQLANKAPATQDGPGVVLQRVPQMGDKEGVGGNVPPAGGV